MSVQLTGCFSRERMQIVKESGVVSGVHKALQLIEEYEGNTAERLNLTRSDFIRSVGLEDCTVCLTINEYIGPDEDQERRLIEIQERVDKVRSENLKASGVASKFPIHAIDAIFGLINDYAGMEGIPVELYATSIADAIRMGIMGFDRFLPFSSMERDVHRTVKEVFDRYRDKIIQNPCCHTISFGEIDVNEDVKAFVYAAGIESMMEAAEKIMPSRYRNTELSRVRTTAPVVIKAQRLQTYIERMPVLFSYQQCLLKEDRPYVSRWLKQVDVYQKKCSPLLPSVVFKEGDSRGVSFSVKKDGLVRGYLQGTMHYVCSQFVPGGKEVARVSKMIQSRLFECAYIGTEVTIPPIPVSSSKHLHLEELYINSMDQVLLQYAYERAIPNIGIDEEDRGGVFVGRQLNSIAETLSIVHSPELQEMMGAMRNGDVEKVKAQIERFPNSSKDIQINSIRNQRMAENIDILLRTSAWQKGFFAIGAHHLIATKSEPESVVELLAQKGWTVDLLQ